ncbi:hypothetical protein SLS62_003524 [Diatrype stigma]|uniref:Uncharacterized protein n=1 Tax=Diatrype stigma TaxID=117547 RepID=A0AAN9YU83_9PEZI
MPVEVVTIVNSSGKIISNGKQLFGVFKEAKACYSEKKASIKAERAVRRAQTFDAGTAPQYQQYTDPIQHSSLWQRRRAATTNDDAASQASSLRSSGSKYSRAPRRARPALTENNLKTHTEVSATPPSRPPAGYQSPYAETVGQEMALSRPTLVPTSGNQQVPMPIFYEDEVLEPYDEPCHEPYQEPYQEPAPAISRAKSDPSIPMHQKHKSIDMDLAYGNIPPDLEFRTDLDPVSKAIEKEQTARELAAKVEQLLTEAHCAHHTATHIIDHLQGNPDAAAAVALTLAELSAVVGKLSPSFLTILKGGSPAVFALLASPQFLIAAGLTVGVTVVMFGGWKIVKQIKDEHMAMTAANRMALPAYPQQQQQQQPMSFEASGYPEDYFQEQEQEQYYADDVIYEDEEYEYDDQGQYPYPEDQDVYNAEGFDEALVLEEELSSIESWRRGIVGPGEDEIADLELISPTAEFAIRSQFGGDDARTERSARTHRTSKTTKTHRTRKSSHRPRSADSNDDRRSEKDSETGSHRTRRTHKTHKTDKTGKTERSAAKGGAVRHAVKAIEDGSRDRENTIDMVLRPKKDSLLKSMFKKRKDTSDDRVKERVKARPSPIKV